MLSVTAKIAKYKDMDIFLFCFWTISYKKLYMISSDVNDVNARC